MTTATATQAELQRRSRLGIRLDQLSALLAVAHGTGGESFRRYSNEIQGSYLSLCSDIAGECCALAQSPGAAQLVQSPDA